MAENLIFGVSVRDFGAVGDGKSDDTEAFVKAFESKSSLICIPFGMYNVSKELFISSKVKINVNPRAYIKFRGITAAENAVKITVNGGKWENTDKENCAFDFSNTSKCTIENASIISDSDCCIGLCNTQKTKLKNLHISSRNTASGIVFGGDVAFTKLNGISFRGCTSAIEIVSGCDNYALIADNIQIKDCEYGLFTKNCVLKKSVLNGISGNSSQDMLHFECGEFSDVDICDINVCDGFIYIEGTKIFSLDIDRFERNTALDTCPSKPTLYIKDCPECTAIFDGMPLDAIILAKKSVPDVKMIAAKMVTGIPTFNNYTLELPIERKDNFIVPCGGFDSLNLFSKKDE